MIAIYTRQSIDKKDSISIDSQIDCCKKELIDDEVYHIYTDKGFSGGNIKRPAFEDLLSDIKVGKISKVIVYKLDRISRSILDFAKIIEIFKKYNVTFSSATEKFDTSTPMGNAMLNITMVFAQLERETIQKRIRDNYYARGKKGFYMGGVTPYGCLKKKTTVDGIKTSTILPDPETYDLLLKLFDRYAHTDTSLGKLAVYMNEKGYKSASGANWDSNKLHRILRNPIYVRADADVYTYYKNRGCNISNELHDFTGTHGCYLYGKRNRSVGKYTDVTDHTLSLALHEGFIDASTWLACQYRLDQNKQLKNSGRGKHTWLTGLTKCGSCEYAMTVKTYKEYKYFSCTGRTTYKICDIKQRTHHVSEIEAYVKDELLGRLSSLKPLEETPESDSYEINQLKLQLIEIDSQIHHLMDQLAEGNDVLIRYANDKIVQLDSLKKTTLETLSQKATKHLISGGQLFEALERVKEWDGLSISEKSSIAKGFIHRILIDNGTIRIEWRS